MRVGPLDPTPANRAVWDVERIQKRSLRLAELAEAYELLSQAYLGLGNAGLPAGGHLAGLALEQREALLLAVALRHHHLDDLPPARDQTDSISGTLCR